MTEPAMFYRAELDEASLRELLAAKGVTPNQVVEGLWHGWTKVRRNAARAAVELGELPDPGPVILKISSLDPDEVVRGAVVEAFGNGTYPLDLAYKVLFGALFDSEQDIADAALAGLERRMTLAPSEAIPLLVLALADPRALVGSVAADLLVKANELAVDHVAPLLGHTDPHLARAAFECFDSLKWQGQKQLVEALLDPRSRRPAQRLLSSMGQLEGAAGDHLVALASDADPVVAKVASGILASQGLASTPPRVAPADIPLPGFFEPAFDIASVDPAAVATTALSELVWALRDGRAAIRARAAALVAVHPKLSAAELNAVLPIARDADSAVRAAAATVVGRIAGLFTDAVTGASERADMALVRLLDDDDAAVADAAGSAIAAQLPARLSPLVLALDIDTGSDALSALRRLTYTHRAKGIAETLADLLKSAPLGAQRGFAATVLGELGDDAAPAIPALVAGLDDPSDEVRVAAADALGLLEADDETVQLALKQASRDPMAAVRRSAALATARLVGRPIDDRPPLPAAELPTPDFASEFLDDKALAAVAKAHAKDLEPLLGFLLDGREAARANASRAAGMVLVATKGEIAPTVERLALGLRDGDAPVRRAVATSLAELGARSQGAAFWLLEALGDPDDQTRAQVALAFGALHNVLPDLLIESLRRDPAVMKHTVLPVYRAIGDPGIELLIAALGHDSALIRINAASCLGELHDAGADRAVDALELRLVDPNNDVQAMAERALRMIRGQPVKPPSVREAEPVPIDGFDDRLLDAAAIKAGLKKTTLPRMVEALADGRPWIRANATVALSLYGDAAREHIGRLVVMTRDGAAIVRRAAVTALREFVDDPQVVTALVQAAHDGDNEVRAGAAVSLSAGLPAAVPLVLDALDSPLPEAYEPAFRAGRHPVWVVAGLGDDSGPVLLKALAHQRPHVRHAGARGFMCLGQERATPYRADLERHLDDPIRLVAAEVAAAIALIDFVPSAAEASEWPVPGFETEVLAAKTLAGAADALTPEQLTGGLSDGRPVVRENAARGLGALGKKARHATGALGRALKDASADVRLAAAEALAVLPADRVAAFDLMRCLGDVDARVVKASDAALSAYGAVAADAFLFGIDDHPTIVSRTVFPALVKHPAALDIIAHGVAKPSGLAKANALSALLFFETSKGEALRAPITRLIEDIDRDVRAAARAALDRLDGVVRPPLLLEPIPLPLPDYDSELLDDKALAKLKSDKAMSGESLDRLLFDGRRFVRRNTALVCGHRGTHTDRLAVLLRDGVPEVRRAACAALALQGDAALTVGPALVASLTDADDEMREAVRELVVSHGAKLAEPLIASLRSPAVASASLDAIDAIGKPMTPALASALESPSGLIRLNTLHALIRLVGRGAEVAREGAEAAQRVPSPRIVNAATDLLRRLDGWTPAAATRPAVKLPTETFADTPLDAAGVKKAAKSADPVWLGDALSDGRAQVRENAARTFVAVGVGEPESLQRLLIALKDSDPAVKAAAARTLGTLKADPTVTVAGLAAAFWGASDEVAQAIDAALGAYSDTVVAKALVGSLEGTEERVKSTISRAGLGREAALTKALVGVITDSTERLPVRENAVSVVGELATRAVGADAGLMAVLNETQGMLTVKAIWALVDSASKPADAAEALKAHLESEVRPSVHLAAHEAIKRLKKRARLG